MMEAVPYQTHPKWLGGPIERRPPTKDNIFQQLAYAFWDFYIFAVDISFFNIRDKKYSTDGHLWTIPIEFKNSIQLFVFVAGSCMLKRFLRVYILLPVVFSFLLYYGSWGLSLFIFGYFLAELHGDILATTTTLPTTVSEKLAPKTSLFKTALHITVALAGLFLASYPRDMHNTENTTGFQFLIPLTPKKYPIGRSKRVDFSHEFWQSVGAMMLVWALMHLPRVQTTVLCNKVVQYFGKISFALYIMHGHAHHSVGYWAVVNGLKMAGIWRLDEKSQKWGLAPGTEFWNSMVVLIAFLFVTFPATVWSADVFWRAADLQSVRFLRWLEAKIKR
ncbi:hypothetical protein ABW20_dc0105665 [Dactylellina cionopaga]|nr:hypothetical protein ABW20_dc0105665 [Dactylellina cionopaga]